ncbi:hypothetical protein GBL71_04600 [Streptococcus equi]|nr:hypothetical protein [Streptococcus equi]NBL40038.1 hypothetical protein [Streptococcus equi]
MGTRFCERCERRNKSEIKNLVDGLSNLIDKCENDFEAMVFNPDRTFDLLLASHSALSKVLREEVTK